jgi:ribosomal protein S18
MEDNPFNVFVEDDGKINNANISTPEQHSFDTLCGQYENLQAQIDKLTFKRDTVRDEITKVLPTSAGTHTKTTNKFEVTLKRRENWSWDSSKLKSLYTGNTLPHFISENLSIHRKHFKNLTTKEQNDLRDALTIKHIKPSIEVRSLNDV